jgi:hypothetical protein
MSMTFDRNLFSQIGLDSGSLTMLSAVIHSFREPGEYRGTVGTEEEGRAVFYVSVDKDSPAAQVNIDLSALVQPADTEKDCGCEERKNRFSVNPKGYAVFHVSGGAGGYHVHLRRARENADEKVFDSRELDDGDIFSAVILRPGTYSVTNAHAKARAEIVVPYPQVGKTPYRPPAPVRVQATRGHFEPRRIELQPGQGLLFECKTPSRIKIELEKPDDGPGLPREPAARGWRKSSLPETDR